MQPPDTLPPSWQRLLALSGAVFAVLFLVGWFGLVGPAVAAMAIAMYVNDDPNASAGNVLFMTGLGVAPALLALLLYRPPSAQSLRTRSSPQPK